MRKHKNPSDWCERFFFSYLQKLSTNNTIENKNKTNGKPHTKGFGFVPWVEPR